VSRSPTDPAVETVSTIAGDGTTAGAGATRGLPTARAGAGVRSGTTIPIRRSVPRARPYPRASTTTNATPRRRAYVRRRARRRASRSSRPTGAPRGEVISVRTGKDLAAYPRCGGAARPNVTATATPSAARRRSTERFEPRPDQQPADLLVLHPAVDQLAVQAHRRERPAAPRAERERGLDGGFAPRAGVHADPDVRVQPGVGQRVDVPLRVVPRDVVVLFRVEGGFVHPGLARLQHVLQVLLEELPAVVVVLPAVGARDHHALGALRLEHPAHRVQVHQVRLDAVALLGRQGLRQALAGLLGDVLVE